MSNISHLKSWIIEVWYKSAVTDPVEGSVLKGIQDLGVQTVSNVKTAQQYVLRGDRLSQVDVERIARELLANPVVQEYRIRPAARA